jgi:uncharacterized membrane protein
MRKGLIIFIVFILMSSFSYSATIYGTVYDLGLEKAQNAKVEINTNPKQVMIASNGTYSFDVPNGKYSIKAFVMQRHNIISFVQENITVSQDGRYVLDLILFPEIEEGLEDPELEVNEVIDGNGKMMYLILGLLLVLLVIFALVARKLYKKEEKTEEKLEEAEHKLEEVLESELSAVVSIIKREGGRTTQKDIRKQIPLSEAKISLMIAELEHKGVIEKIKKGRGNIIILKRK